MRHCRLTLLAACAMTLSGFTQADSNRIDDGVFRSKDVFDLEYSADPRMSPDASQVVYVRNFFDVMKDRQRSNLWIAYILQWFNDHRDGTVPRKE